MQTKHLHVLLPILLLIGCGSEKFSSDNPYLHDTKTVELSFPDAASDPVMCFGEVDLAVAPQSEAGDPFSIQMHPQTGGRWIGGLKVDGFNFDAAKVSRTLSSLVIDDSTSNWRYAASALPGGSGVAFYLEGEVYTDVRFTLAPAIKDTLFLRGFKGDRVETYLLEDSSYLAVTSAPSFADKSEARGLGFEMHRRLKDGKKRQVILAFAPTANRAKEIASTYRGMTRDKLERAARDTLAQDIAFSLRTDDDRTNEAFALLSAALVNAENRVSLGSHAQIEDGAAATCGLFLASGDRPTIAFATDRKTQSLRVRWGSAAYRDALIYGMADDDSLKNASLAVLEDVASLSGEYAKDLLALDPEVAGDTLQRLAEAHVRYAELLTLCGDISVARGDRDAEANFRREALRAAKNGRRFFREAGALYRQDQDGGGLEDPLALPAPEEEADSEDVALTLPATGSGNPPDTLRYARTGARYGFSWLAERPQELMRTTLDGYTWQKWTAQRFADDLKVTQTPDLDSLLTMLLQSPVPGVLTADPAHDGEPSLAVMAVSLENLSELYLGVHPNWMQHRVDVLPRPPQRWGKTAARVPFGTGFLILEYDFENSVAYVGMKGIERQLDIFFGYPLPTGGFSRTQFALSPDEPRMEIKMSRDSENRVKLDVNPAG